jgi:antitoxin (DNA-binding transcriptional repressor) of toxin-antitoxin stability system
VVKRISVGELRQNPTAMVDDLEHGEPYTLTRHNRAVGTILPAASSTVIIPRRRTGAASTRTIARHQLRTASSIDELVNDAQGDW